MRERLELLVLPDRPDPDESGTPAGAPPSRPLLALMRPKQWAKNLLVFAAPGAAGLLSTPSVAARAGVAFVSMCLVASGTYILNDVLDAAADRIHPHKRSRPVASGHVTAGTALALAAALLATGAGLAAFLGWGFVAVVAAYMGLSIAYSVALKRFEVIDIAIIAACFVLRAVAGAAATDVTLSSWFLILVSAGALLVVAGKRMADLRYARAAGLDAFDEGRAVYPEPFLRGVWILSTGVAITAYCLWSQAFPHDIDGIAWSQVSVVPFVIALLRYALVIERGEASAPEEVFLRDRVLQVVVVTWALTYAAGIYL